MFNSRSRSSDRRFFRLLRRGGRDGQRFPGDRHPRLEVVRLEDRTLLSVDLISQYTSVVLKSQNEGHTPGLTPGGVGAAPNIGSVFEGIDYNGSNCGCYPPDPNAAVGNNDVVEIVNEQIRMFDKTTGSVLLNESLATFFGASSGGDPYVVYDDIANRWYAEGMDSSDAGFFLAVSIDGNPLDGFRPTYHLTNGLGGATTDYPKMGFNKDAIFISYNNFGNGTDAATVVAIDKGAALSGTLTYYVSTPEFQFRAMPPAQMHGDGTGGTEWFISTDGSDTGGTTIRVTKMTNYLSNTPTFTYTSLPVQQYNAPANSANQPGGTVTVFPNTTTTQVDFRNGLMVTTLGTADASDNYGFEHAHWYEVDVTSGTPVLAHEGVVPANAGVTDQMPSAALDLNGQIGMTWIQSSSSEYVSMYVGTVDPTTGVVSSAVAKPGLSFMTYNGRIGDYSSAVLDPSTNSFWAANEYIGANGSTDIWNTAIANFSAGSLPSADLAVTNPLGGPATATEGDKTLTYTITVTNNGPNNAPGVVLTDTLDPNLKFVSAMTQQGNFTQSGGVVTFSLGAINNGVTVTATVTAQAIEDGSLTDSATVNYGNDPNSGNNTGSATTVVSEAPINPQTTTITTTAKKLTNFTVATFTHANGVEPATAFIASINWGDGKTSSGTITQQADGSYVVKGSHSYGGRPGTHTITTTVTEAGSNPNVPATAAAASLPGPLNALSADRVNRGSAVPLAGTGRTSAIVSLVPGSSSGQTDLRDAVSSRSSGGVESAIAILDLDLSLQAEQPLSSQGIGLKISGRAKPRSIWIS
jgi:uncharacterized repeat protein (TIGR01451 family)